MYVALETHLSQTPIRDDRVHPNEFGHHLMAETFLCAMGLKSNIEISKKFCITDENKKRYDAEQKYRNLLFIEQNIMGWQFEPTKSIEERKQIIQNTMKDKSNIVWTYLSDFDSYGKFYLDNVDFKEEILGKLVEFTLRMYK